MKRQDIALIGLIFLILLVMFCYADFTDTSTSEKEAEHKFDYSNFDYALRYPEKTFEPIDLSGRGGTLRRYFMRDRKTGVVYLRWAKACFPLYDSEGKVIIRKVKKSL